KTFIQSALPQLGQVRTAYCSNCCTTPLKSCLNSLLRIPVSISTGNCLELNLTPQLGHLTAMFARCMLSWISVGNRSHPSGAELSGHAPIREPGEPSVYIMRTGRSG